MITTAFLSMWISNTAATAMMLPILEAILVELVRDKDSKIRIAEENDVESQMIHKTSEKGNKSKQISTEYPYYTYYMQIS